MNIDSHHHFWRYNREEFGWIDDSMKRIQRDFLPEDLSGELQEAGIDGVVSVQARQIVEETEWLLSLAREHEFIKGVVGWVPLVDRRMRSWLERFCDHPKLKAVRHVVQGEPDDQFILREDFSAGVAAVAEIGLVYDILIFERHLPQTIDFVDRHPNQTFVLGHIAKPRITDDMMEPWATHIRELSRRSNVYCKVSGMVTEADFARWTIDQLKPYWDTVLEAFTPRRLMYGSDWPVCLVACEYSEWFETVRTLAQDLTASEQARLFGETANEAYRLGV